MVAQEKHVPLVKELSELEWMIGQWHPVEGMGYTEKDDWEYLILSDPYRRKPSNMVIRVADEGHSLMVTYHVDKYFGELTGWDAEVEEKICWDKLYGKFRVKTRITESFNLRGTQLIVDDYFLERHYAVSAWHETGNILPESRHSYRQLKDPQKLIRRGFFDIANSSALKEMDLGRGLTVLFERVDTTIEE